MGARWVQIWLLFLARICCAVTRLALAPLMLNIAKDSPYTAVERGSVLGAFTAGYTITQLLGGYIDKKVGTRTYVVVMLLTNAIVGFVTPMAIVHSFSAFWCIIFISGFFQGPIFSLCNIMCGRWILPNERSRASAMIDNGGTFGNLIVTCIVPWVSYTYGWTSVLQLTGFCNLLLSCAWFTAAADGPQQCWYIQSGEAALLKLLQTANLPSQNTRFGVSLIQKAKQVVMPLLHTSVWALFWLHAMFNLINYFMAQWIIIYLVQFHAVPQSKA